MHDTANTKSVVSDVHHMLDLTTINMFRSQSLSGPIFYTNNKHFRKHKAQRRPTLALCCRASPHLAALECDGGVTARRHPDIWGHTS